MTQLLERAFEAAAKLPPAEQDAVAAQLLAALDMEEAWPETLERTQDVLERLADEALDEHREGRTEPLDPDRL